MSTPYSIDTAREFWKKATPAEREATLRRPASHIDKVYHRYMVTWLDGKIRRQLSVRARTKDEAWERAKVPAGWAQVNIKYCGTGLTIINPSEPLAEGCEWWIIDYVLPPTVFDMNGTRKHGFCVSQGVTAHDAWLLSSAANTPISFSDCTFMRLSQQ